MNPLPSLFFTATQRLAIFFRLWQRYLRAVAWIIIREWKGKYPELTNAKRKLSVQCFFFYSIISMGYDTQFLHPLYTSHKQNYSLIIRTVLHLCRCRVLKIPLKLYKYTHLHILQFCLLFNLNTMGNIEWLKNGCISEMVKVFA